MWCVRARAALISELVWPAPASIEDKVRRITYEAEVTPQRDSHHSIRVGARDRPGRIMVKNHARKNAAKKAGGKHTKALRLIELDQIATDLGVRTSDWYDSAGVTIIAGPRGSGKSLLARRLAPDALWSREGTDAALRHVAAEAAKLGVPLVVDDLASSSALAKLLSCFGASGPALIVTTEERPGELAHVDATIVRTVLNTDVIVVWKGLAVWSVRFAAPTLAELNLLHHVRVVGHDGSVVCSGCSESSGAGVRWQRAQALGHHVLRVGEQVRLGHDSNRARWWTVRVSDERYSILTRQADFRPKGQMLYTIIDTVRGVRGPCDLISMRWDMTMRWDMSRDEDCADMLRALNAHASRGVSDAPRAADEITTQVASNVPIEILARR